MEIKIYNNPQNWFYRVKKSDEDISIEKFVLRFNIKKEDFDFLNPNATSLRQGDVLIIPQSEQFCHIVAPLETFETISKKFQVPVSNLKSICNSSVLFVGQRIFIWFFKKWCYTKSC